jgi:hypothetical protein
VKSERVRNWPSLYADEGNPINSKNHRHRSVVCKSLVMLVSYSYQLWGRKLLKEPTVPLPLLSDSWLPRRQSIRLKLLVTPVICNNCIDCFVEYIIDAGHLLAAALHITSPHLSSNCHPLLLGDGSKALGLEKIDACSLCSKVRF